MLAHKIKLAYFVYLVFLIGVGFILGRSFLAGVFFSLLIFILESLGRLENGANQWGLKKVWRKIKSGRTVVEIAAGFPIGHGLVSRSLWFVVLWLPISFWLFSSTNLAGVALTLGLSAQILAYLWSLRQQKLSACQQLLMVKEISRSQLDFWRTIWSLWFVFLNLWLLKLIIVSIELSANS